MKRSIVIFGSLTLTSALGYGQLPGMYVLEFPGNNLKPVTKYIMNQPVVRGGNIVVVWRDVDKGGGVYDWSKVDSAIAPWAAIKKPVNLIVWGVNELQPGVRHKSGS
jgi:hypothetical protein